MSKKTCGILSVIAVIALCLSLVSLVLTLKTPVQPSRDLQYVLYIGTNDKDTNEPVFSPEEAKMKAEEILVSHFSGYTIQEANGGWTENDTMHQAYTLVIHLSDTTSDAVYAAADEMIRTFHQSSVLIQANETTTEFYNGGN